MNDRQRLIKAAHDNWAANPGVDPAVMRDLGYDTPETLPATIERVMGEQTTTPVVGLELVTDDHAPMAGAKREASLRSPQPARTARDKAARDMGERLKHVTPPEWQPSLTVLSGGTGSNKRTPSR